MSTFVERMRCIPRFLALANQRAASTIDAATLDDLAQEVFALVWKRLPDYRGEASLTTWVWQFCTRQFAACVRKARGGHREVAIESDLGELSFNDEEPRDHDALHRAVLDLEQSERVVVVARHFGDMTFQEIAVRFEASENTMKTRYYRAIDRLRRSLRRSFDGEGAKR